MWHELVSHVKLTTPSGQTNVHSQSICKENKVNQVGSLVKWMTDKSIDFSKIFFYICLYYTLETYRNCGCISNFTWLDVLRYTILSRRDFEVPYHEIWGDVVYCTTNLKFQCWQSHINLMQRNFCSLGVLTFGLRYSKAVYWECISVPPHFELCYKNFNKVWYYVSDFNTK